MTTRNCIPCGKLDSSWAIVCWTACETWIVLAFACLVKRSVTAGTPLTRAIEEAGACVSSMVATSLTSTGPLAVSATTMLPSC